jgi:hypothetical protein
MAQFLRAPVPLAAIVCIALSILLRIAVGVNRPFWLDEAWTGATILQPDIQHLFHQVYMDWNAPLYPVLMYGWGKLFGYSDFALRFPSLLFGIATPLLIAGSRRAAGLDDDERLAWAAMLSLSFPAIWFSQEARCYSLLLLVCTAQALALGRLIARPGIAKACWWAAWSSVGILIHYHAVFVTLTQGLIYLFVCRKQAFKTWPAAVVFAPTFAWILFHLPRVLEFPRLGKVWYSNLQLEDIPGLFVFLCGTPAFPLVFGLALAVAAWTRLRARADAPANHTFAANSLEARCIVAASLGAAALVISIGLFKPFLVSRYLIPVVPGITLGAVLLWKFSNPPWAHSLRTLLVACLCASAVMTVKAARQPIAPSVFSYETAARDLAAQGITNLVFAWDNPTSPAIDRSTFEALGGFFFDRLHRKVAVTPVNLQGSRIEASAALLDQVRSPGTGILWLYDLGVHDTVARITPPKIDKLDPSWICHNYAPNNFGVFACYQRPTT